MKSGAPAETDFLPTTDFLGSLERSRAAARTVDTVEGPLAVYELDPGAMNPGPRTLVFEGQDRYWRLANYPSNWRILGDEELVALHGDCRAR